MDHEKVQAAFQEAQLLLGQLEAAVARLRRALLGVGPSTVTIQRRIATRPPPSEHAVTKAREAVLARLQDVGPCHLSSIARSPARREAVSRMVAEGTAFVEGPLLALAPSQLHP